MTSLLIVLGSDFSIRRGNYFIIYKHIRHDLTRYGPVVQQKFERDGVDLITSARVQEVHPDHVVYTTKNADGTVESHEIPANFVLWSTGIAMNPFVQRVSDLLYVLQYQSSP